MARTGRKPLAAAALERLDRSSRAKQRLPMIIKTMREELTIPEACRQLGIGESRFHAMRNQWLQEALQLLEPRSIGRPPKRDPPADTAQLEELQEEVQQLQSEVVASEVRRQIAQVMPHVIKEPNTSKKGADWEAEAPAPAISDAGRCTDVRPQCR